MLSRCVGSSCRSGKPCQDRPDQARPSQAGSGEVMGWVLLCGCGRGGDAFARQRHTLLPAGWPAVKGCFSRLCVAMMIMLGPTSPLSRSGGFDLGGWTMTTMMTTVAVAVADRLLFFATATPQKKKVLLCF